MKAHSEHSQARTLAATALNPSYQLMAPKYNDYLDGGSYNSYASNTTTSNSFGFNLAQPYPGLPTTCSNPREGCELVTPTSSTTKPNHHSSTTMSTLVGHQQQQQRAIIPSSGSQNQHSPAFTCYDYNAFGTRFALLMESLRAIGNQSHSSTRPTQQAGLLLAASKPNLLYHQAMVANQSNHLLQQQQVDQTNALSSLSTANQVLNSKSSFLSPDQQYHHQNEAQVFGRNLHPLSYINPQRQQQTCTATDDSQVCLSPACSSRKSNLSSPSTTSSSSSSRLD